MPYASGDIAEAGDVLLRGLNDLNDGRRRIGIHTQHPGSERHLRAPKLGGGQRGCER